MTTETDLIAMARECGAIRMLREDRSPNGDYCFSPAQLAAFRAAILADAAKDVEPVAWGYMVNGVHANLGWHEPPDDAYDTGTLVPLCRASTVAALQAQVAHLTRANVEHENRRVFEAGVAYGLADRVKELESDRDSWRDQASARVADAVQFVQERDQALTRVAELEAQLLAARAKLSAQPAPCRDCGRLEGHAPFCSFNY